MKFGAPRTLGPGTLCRTPRNHLARRSQVIKFAAHTIMKPSLSICLALGLSCLPAVTAVPAETALPPPATRVVDFEKELAPLFAERCYDCHGEKKQESGLRTDNRADLLKGGDNGPALVVGKSAESILVQVLADTHEEIAAMPKKKEKFTPAQIGLVRAWIDQGAIWEGGGAKSYSYNTNHWAFKAPVRPAPPAVSNQKWSRTPIDHFILAKLDTEKLKPSPEADKITLLRRLSLDLIGLPPTPEEVDAFVADKASDAYAKQVERLLASPHYGEKWGRFWLDAARYADSDGFEKDKTRNVWFYRDWVVKAFNDDVPYDLFVLKQLAGDLLPNATQDDIVATGFLRNSMINEEGGIDPEQFRMEAMFDRMDAIGKSVLGLTIQCAQCHDHKFDPISQQEYFSLFAFLNNDHEAKRIVYPPDQQMRVANISREISDLEAGLRHRTPDWEERMARWEDSVTTNQPTWTVLRPVVEDITTGGQKFLPQPDGSFLAQGYAVGKSGPHFWLTNDLQGITAIRFEQLTDPNLPCNGPGRSLRGIGALSEFTVDLSPLDSTNKTRLKLTNTTADFSMPKSGLTPEHFDLALSNRVVGPVTFAIDGDESTAWGIDAGPGRRNTDRVAVFQCEQPAGLAGGTVWDIRVIQRHGGPINDAHQNYNLGRFRISVTTNAGPIVADSVPKRVRDILAIPREKRSPQQVAAVFSYWRTLQTEFAETNERIEKLWAQWPEGETQLTLMARDEPRETRLLKRGDFLKPGNPVQADTPAFLHPLPPNADDSRLTLAHWLMDKKSPTTARSFVNRIWQSYFGTGLLEASEDFGTRAELPSHPELLDWMACEFMEPTNNEGRARGNPGPPVRAEFNDKKNGAHGVTRPTLESWNIKHLHRLIVNSATYRQSSHVTPELYSRDPFNRLLARGPRFRVEGEIVRDIALASSGLLNPALGGHSVFPPAPEFLFLPPVSYGPKDWPVSTGSDRYRRSLYIFRFRSVPYPLLQTFDTPNGDFSCVRRLRSNTPLQALVSLNETTFMECAQALARKTLAEGGKSDVDKINFAFRRALSRLPRDTERKELLALLDKQKDYIAEGWVNANELASGKNVAPEKLPQGATPTQLAAYTVVSRVLLNLDETITKE
jgi:mono/diheme cytochrome c family protein